MRTIYDGVDMMPLETLYFDWEPLYDPTGVDYLYTRVAMAARSLINGQSSVGPVVNGPPMNYAFEGASIATQGSPVRRANPTTTPPQSPGLTVPQAFGIKDRTPSTLRNIVKDPTGPGTPNSTDTTHLSIRHRLSVPRKKLYIFWGTGMESGTPIAGTSDPPNPLVANLFLESPLPGAKCDCKNGPFPRVFSVTQALGDAMTLIVDWGVETFVNEAALNDVRPSSALLSNRFSQIHGVDDMGYTTITTSGVAIFRTDHVYGIDGGPTAITPDQMRSYLFMPIPKYFKRVINYLRGREDVTGVEYSYTDTQVHANFVAGPFVKAADIHAVHSQTITTQADLIGSAVASYERMLNIRANRRFAKGEETKPLSAQQPTPSFSRVPRKGGGSPPKTPPTQGPAPTALPPGGKPVTPGKTP